MSSEKKIANENVMYMTGDENDGRIVDNSKTSKSKITDLKEFMIKKR